MKKPLPAWAVLGIIALAAGMLLGFTNELTAPAIARQNEAAAQAARQSVLPAAVEFAPVQETAGGGVDNCYVGRANGQIVGYVAQATAKGYGGEIQVTVGMDTSGVITGISVGGANFKETAGLGANAKNPEFQAQFVGLEAPVVLGQGVDSITGATITTQAVITAVNTAADHMQGLMN